MNVNNNEFLINKSPNLSPREVNRSVVPDAGNQVPVSQVERENPIVVQNESSQEVLGVPLTERKTDAVEDKGFLLLLEKIENFTKARKANNPNWILNITEVEVVDSNEVDSDDEYSREIENEMRNQILYLEKNNKSPFINPWDIVLSRLDELDEYGGTMLHRIAMGLDCYSFHIDIRKYDVESILSDYQVASGKRLLDYLKAKNNEGNTALHVAAIQEKSIDVLNQILDCVKRRLQMSDLIDFLSQKNNNGQTALALAEENGFVGSLKLIVDAYDYEPSDDSGDESY